MIENSYTDFFELQEMNKNTLITASSFITGILILQF